MSVFHSFASSATSRPPTAQTAIPGSAGAQPFVRRGRRRGLTSSVPVVVSFPLNSSESTPLAEPLERLRAMLELLNARFVEFDDNELSHPLQPGGWSRKQILGHLLDSAANNHRRFVLCRLEAAPYPIMFYDQDGWVACGAYQSAPAQELLQLWTLYNQQLARLLAHLPADALSHRCQFDNGYAVTLGWLVEDYVVHLEHHVRQIIN